MTQGEAHRIPLVNGLSTIPASPERLHVGDDNELVRIARRDTRGDSLSLRYGAASLLDVLARWLNQ